ncbi:MAG: N-acetylmuramoyl-L-alanine amidase [Polyangiaceae bacterium]|nr:N-acetylmuramoyl-L-alanine amidase [Polyangiaceae bacterium]
MLQRTWGSRGCLVVVLLVLGAVGCGAKEAPAPADVTAPPTDAERALALLDPASTLPPRVEIVALCDAVAVAASKAPTVDEQARLYRVAADLRARIWRLDRAEADAREALELYAITARTARGKEPGCEADRARALLAGELPQDASITYRYLYLAKRRHAELATAVDGSACVAAIDRHLAMSVAYRPSGEELAALEREGDRAEQLARGPAPASAEPDASAAPPASAAGAASIPRDVIVAPSALAPAKGPVKITKIEKYPGEGGGRVVVFLSEPTAFKVGALEADGGRDARIFVDIDQAGAKGIAREIEVGGAIKRVRTGPRADATRIVLDLAAKMHRRVFYLPAPFRIVIDVSARPPEASPSGSGPRTVKRVAIDPGHGGNDAGAVGPTGLKEKDVTLDIAQRIAPVLADELKIETLLTRDRDVFVPLDERTARANAFHADLFVSIHCNASETGDARGIEVFILDEIKDMSRAAARITALENGLPLSGALDASALDAEMASIATRLGSGQIAESSRLLGMLLGRATMASLSQRYPDTSDHGLKSAGFYVLAGAEMPAVLFETSFISNPDDESRLAKVDYRQRIADGVVNAIRAYREGKK